jgi:hypothetical protein
MIRRAVLRYGLPYATTLAGACAMASGIEAMKRRGLAVRSVQDFHKESGKWTPQEFGDESERRNDTDSVASHE